MQIAHLQEDLKMARSQLTIFESDKSKLTEESNTLRLLLLQKEVNNMSTYFYFKLLGLRLSLLPFYRSFCLNKKPTVLKWRLSYS